MAATSKNLIAHFTEGGADTDELWASLRANAGHSQVKHGKTYLLGESRDFFVLAVRRSNSGRLIAEAGPALQGEIKQRTFMEAVAIDLHERNSAIVTNGLVQSPKPLLGNYRHGDWFQITGFDSSVLAPDGKLYSHSRILPSRSRLGPDPHLIRIEAKISPSRNPTVTSVRRHKRIAAVERALAILSGVPITRPLNAIAWTKVDNGDRQGTHLLESGIDLCFADSTEFTDPEQQQDVPRLAKATYRRKSVGSDQLTLPDDADTFFKAFHALHHPNAAQAARAGEWILVANWLHGIPELAILSYAIAIESIMSPTQPSRCDTCGHEKLQISQRFRTLIERYSNGVYGKQSGSFYSLRSAIAHGNHDYASVDTLFGEPLTPLKDVIRAMNSTAQTVSEWILSSDRSANV